jgi:hypothetical protein
MRVKWCHACGRMGAFNFLFCPWCGEEYAEKPEASDIIDESLDSLERQASQRNNPIDTLERKLNNLDRDLRDFLEQAESEFPVDSFGKDGDQLSR